MSASHERWRAKRCVTCPKCGAPPKHRCVNMAKTDGWTEHTTRRQENRHVHYERVAQFLREREP